VSLAANRAQAIVRPAHSAEVTAAPLAYVGIVTRTIAFAADAAVIQIAAIAVAGTFALILSVLSPPDKFDGLILVVGSAVYCLWLVGYFVVFWSATGQTPGNRLLQIRVCRADAGTVPSAGAALLRFFGLIVAALPLFAGFLPILLDDRRRGVHDMLAGTVVVSAPPAEITARRS
jgi:uncharacterized RDD family membrane protein YckC